MQEVQGRSCLTDFHGMQLTRDKICSLIKPLASVINQFNSILSLYLSRKLASAS